jgi:hypothetical protein
VYFQKGKKTSTQSFSKGQKNAISGELSPEVGEPPGGGEEDVVTTDISGEPGPEVGEPPPTWPPLFAPSSARSGNPFSPLARGGDSSVKRSSSAPEVLQPHRPETSQRPSLLCVLVRRRRFTDARREKTRETQCESLALCFINPHFTKNFPLGFASPLLQVAGALF